MERMNKMNKDQIAVSLMCMDFLKIKEQLEVLNESVGMYHIDIMDGHFCKNITLSPDLIKSFKCLIHYYFFHLQYIMILIFNV